MICTRKEIRIQSFYILNERLLDDSLQKRCQNFWILYFISHLGSNFKISC